jgi:hypothetical protein
MNYAVEMGSGAMTYVIKFHTVWFSHSKVDRKDTQTAWISYKPTFIFSQ